MTADPPQNFTVILSNLADYITHVHADCNMATWILVIGQLDVFFRKYVTERMDFPRDMEYILTILRQTMKIQNINSFKVPQFFHNLQQFNMDFLFRKINPSSGNLLRGQTFSGTFLPSARRNLYRRTFGTVSFLPSYHSSRFSAHRRLTGQRFLRVEGRKGPENVCLQADFPRVTVPHRYRPPLDGIPQVDTFEDQKGGEKGRGTQF